MWITKSLRMQTNAPILFRTHHTYCFDIIFPSAPKDSLVLTKSMTMLVTTFYVMGRIHYFYRIFWHHIQHYLNQSECVMQM